jgi:hypothetical protein
LGQHRVDVAPAAQHPRDGGRGHARSTRDVVDRGHGCIPALRVADRPGLRAGTPVGE